MGVHMGCSPKVRVGMPTPEMQGILGVSSQRPVRLRRGDKLVKMLQATHPSSLCVLVLWWQS